MGQHFKSLSIPPLFPVRICGRKSAFLYAGTGHETRGAECSWIQTHLKPFRVLAAPVQVFPKQHSVFIRERKKKDSFSFLSN